MFGIFDSAESKLRKVLNKNVNLMIDDALKMSPDPISAGYLVNLAISEFYKSYKNNYVAIAREYNLNPDLTLSIIKECTNKALSENLDDAEDYYV